MEKQGQKLYNLSHENETADAIVHALATRERMRHFIDIRRLKYNLKKEGFRIVDEDFMNLWKEWEKMGLGTIAKGRIDKDDRFIMNYDMRKVAEASIKGTDLTVDDKKTTSGVVLAPAAPKKRGRKKKSTTAIKHIKKPVTVSIQTNNIDLILPKNITKADIQELARTLNEMA